MPVPWKQRRDERKDCVAVNSFEVISIVDDNSGTKMNNDN